MGKEVTLQADDRLGNALCHFSKGEERGAHLLRQLLDFAPNDDIRQQVAQQVIDEERHHRLFSARLKHLDLDCQGLKRHLSSLYDLAQECVDRRDWTECMAIQAAIEELAMASFGHALKTLQLDDETRATILGVIADERRHLEFGMGQLQAFAQDRQGRSKIESVQREVIGLMLHTAKTDDAADRAARAAIMLQAYRAHQARCKAIGITVPSISGL
jgi:rubrerythrin